MIDIEELKKLPTHVKVDLIDQLLHSVNENEEHSMDNTDVDEAIIKEMEQRLDDMESGKDAGYTWEEAKAILLEDINKRKLTHG